MPNPLLRYVMVFSGMVNGLNGTVKSLNVALPEKQIRALLFSVDSPNL